MKRIFSIMLSVTMLVAAASIGTAFAKTDESSTGAANIIAFSDVNDNTPGSEAIKKLVNAGIVKGYGDGTFRPNSILTRAELAKMVNLVFGYTEASEENFWDVSKDDWYYDQVLIAKKAGYIVGFEDGSFGGGRTLTREQVCVIINRCANLMPLDTGIKVSDKVSDWAIEAVNKVVSNMLMPLGENNTFRATENITRVELAQLLSYFVKEAPTETKPTEPTPTPPDSDSTSTTEPQTKPSGGGGSSRPTKPTKPTKPSFDNSEVVSYLNNVVKDIESLFSGGSVRLTDSERDVLIPIRRALKDAISKADEVEITKEFVKKEYADDINEAMAAYEALGDDQAKFRTTILNAVDQETQNFLIEYFL